MITPIDLDLEEAKRMYGSKQVANQDEKPLRYSIWMVLFAFVCGGLTASIPMLTVGYHYGEEDMERAACRAGVAHYEYAEDGNHTFVFDSNKNQVPNLPNKPSFLK